jgi:type IX secretion system PorP/SprF family membrane protein
MKLIKYLASCLMIVAAGRVAAQTDPHFTQNYTYPMYINPAMTGGSDGDYRVSAIYRGQWGGITNPYKTTGVSFDARTNKNLALGLNIQNQSAGDGGFNYFNTTASFAYTGVKLGSDENHRMVFAMQFGLLNRSVDQSKFKWGEQWNPITGYNANNPISESFSATSATTLDIGAGAMYYDATPGKKTNVFGGFSTYHLNRPKDPIISSQSTELNTIPMRYVLHGGVSVNISDRIRIIPHALYMRQGTARETMFGAYAELNVNAETDVMVGGYYRINDAFAPFVGFNYKNFIVGASYDVNASKLTAMTRNVNSFELSFTFIKRTKAAKNIFGFNPCPRL